MRVKSSPNWPMCFDGTIWMWSSAKMKNDNEQTAPLLKVYLDLRQYLGNTCDGYVHIWQTEAHPSNQNAWLRSIQKPDGASFSRG